MLKKLLSLCFRTLTNCRFVFLLKDLKKLFFLQSIAKNLSYFGHRLPLLKNE